MECAKTLFVSYWQHFFTNIEVRPFVKLLADLKKQGFWQVFPE